MKQTPGHHSQKNHIFSLQVWTNHYISRPRTFINNCLSTVFAECHILNFCSGHGRCIAGITCQCDVGWLTADCSVPVCDTVSECLGHGTCVSPNVCQCQDGWTGTDCSVYTCKDLSNCLPGGRCIGPNQCLCQEGWNGRDCSFPICNQACFSHGTCVAPNQCQCNTGWTGSTCNELVPPGGGSGQQEGTLFGVVFMSNSQNKVSGYNAIYISTKAEEATVKVR